VIRSDKILLDLLRRDWQADAPIPDVHSEDEWTAVIEAALRHGVAGLVCRSLMQLRSNVPADIASAASGYLARTEAAGARRLRDLFDVLDVLADDGIAAITFKGPALGVLAHASPTLRPSRDIDLLFHRGDMARAVTSLRRLGYRARDSFSPAVMESYYDTYGQVMLLANGRTPLEPHCAFAPRAFAVDLDIEDLWQRAASIAIGDRSVLALSAEDALLTACIHGTKEKWWRLLWVADVAALVHRNRSLAYDAIAARAESVGALRMLLLGLALARQFFACDVPPWMAEAIDHDAACARLVDDSKRYLFEPASAVGSVNRFSRYHYLARERPSDRLRYAYRLATTPGENHFRMIQLPESFVGGYVAVKVVHDFVLLPMWKVTKRAIGRRGRIS
jgi:hypothetical protein